MRSSVPGIAARLRLGAILSLLMLLCAAAPSARAGCSAAHLGPRAQAAAEAYGLAPLFLGGSATPDQDETPPSRPAPCSGALCSGNPGVPPSTAPLTVVGVGSDWAVALSTPVLAAPGSIVRAREDARLAPVNQPSSIFHPPRRPSA
jgi:hypothetical protein